jgi:hypothetical protein
MKRITTILPAITLAAATALPVARAASGFTESDVVFYGEVRQSGGGQTVLLQAGELKLTFVNQSNPANVVTLETELRPTGTGQTRLFSYSLNVPLAYLPEPGRMDEFLSIGSTTTQFKIQQITINGVPATLSDGSKEFYGLGFSSRSSDYRLDLLVGGSSADSDGDGTPDWWESLYGLDPNLATTNSDFDGDGWTDLQEFRLGSDPSVSNRAPLLVTPEIIVPESGEAGVFLRILDSDTADSGIAVTLGGCAADSGFELKVDGVVVPPGDTRQFMLSQIKSGRVTLRHTGAVAHGTTLPVSWHDGGEVAEGQILASAVVPATQDGGVTTLWLDGQGLPADGQPVSTWSDRSGHGRHAMQPVAAHQPRVTARSVDFSATPSAHLFFQDSGLPTGNQTVLASYSAAGSSTEPQTLLSTNRGYFQLTPTAQAVSYPGTPVYQMDGVAVRGFEKAAGSTTTSAFRRNGSLLQNIAGAAHDGANTAVSEIEPVLPTLGARRSAIPGDGPPVDEAFHGQLHELLVYAGALPEQQLRDASDYLESKWSGAVIWDFSTEMTDHQLGSTGDTRRRIIRGGFGADQLAGGPLDDTISSGAGDDVLTGGGGADRFVFGGVDTGKDRITDFDQTTDIIDLSALFWGMTGDARSHVSLRLDANYSTPVPTLDSVLVVAVPGETTMEIVLQNTVVSATQLIRLIVEGRIRMGGLSIPTTLQLVDTSSAVPRSESLDQSFAITVTRSGAGLPAALEVPVGFFAEALGGDFVVDGPVPAEGRRAVIRLARGETSKTLTVRPLPDLVTEGTEPWQVSVLPHFRYTAGSTQVTQVVSDNPMLRTEILEANAVASSGQAARVRIHRDGDLSQGLVVDLELAGTAKEGIHLQQVPDSITIPAGVDSVDLTVSALSSGLSSGPKVALLRLAARDRYLLGSPHEAVLYAAVTAAEANTAGFDRWLQTSTGGLINSFADLVATSPGAVDSYLRAYAFGLDAVDSPGAQGIHLHIVDGRPEITTASELDAADLRWSIESSSANLTSWADAGASFVPVPVANGLKLVGPPLDPGAQTKFYRLNLTLDPGQLAGTAITALAGGERYGIGGDATWSTDAKSGNLITTGGTTGQAHRVIAETDGAETLDFAMSIKGAAAGDRLAFYIDGVKLAETAGGAVQVHTSVASPGVRLMWEFTRANTSSRAVIAPSAP